VIIDLEPPEGVPPVRLGMTRDEARAPLATWGDVSPFRRTPDGELGWQVLGPAVQGFVYVDTSGRVNAIEFARPRTKDVDIRYRDTSIFSEAALDVLARLEERGIRIEASDPYFPEAPDLYLGFSRDSGEEVSPVDGLSLHFESVLVAAPGYGSGTG